MMGCFVQSIGIEYLLMKLESVPGSKFINHWGKKRRGSARVECAERSRPYNDVGSIEVGSE